ncbi:MAG: alkaline phosphatase family protein [Chromatiaceae bacterium]|nr:alkaline phosphatase family protein [Chromatiaceae bacterium]
MTAPALPLVLAGPVLRRLTTERLVLWLVLREPARARLVLDCGEDAPRVYPLELGTAGCRMLTAGAHLHYLLIDLPLERPLPIDRWIGYDLRLQPLADVSAPWQGWRDWAPDLGYPGQDSPGFVLPARIGALLHGSCRKPHHRGGDGLVQADRLLARCLAGASGGADASAPDDLPAWPSLLMLTGDQIYADDVAGPMLRAIHGLIARLGLPVETLAGAGIGLPDAEALYRHPAGYYRRETLLPRHRRNYALIEILFGGVEKPVFTTASAHNHLITLGEVLGMYLLVWSPVPWQGLDLSPPPQLDSASRALYDSERPLIEAFVAELPAVRRVLAHLPVAMIFDDHDITDDWNLSREWEEIAYGHPFSKRVIGNALIGYLIHQGWGNRPEVFDPALLDAVQQGLAAPGGAAHDVGIDRLLRFGDWHYEWPTHPPLVVIDTRTHRWRSERAAREPSGLLDWEALTDLQQTLRGQPAVLLVSPAPIFGVKLIETIQRVFTSLGKPLLVDAENWMAHPGAAHAILNIFRHPKTPEHFVVLSGDVHYSFVYDVELRGRVRGPDIWQICSSGVRNEFPPRLLAALDRANRWLYSPRSPLNWFTRRRHLRVIPRKPEGTPHGRRLLNGSGIGLVELDPSGVPWRIRELLADGRVVPFTRREAESRWD